MHSIVPETPGPEESQGIHLTRRQLTRAAAWSVPIIALAVASPAAAASDPCVPNTVLALTQVPWSVTAGQLQATENQTGFYTQGSESGFKSWDNNALRTATTTVVASYSFPLHSGAAYSVSYKIRIGEGSGTGTADGLVKIQTVAGSTVQQDYIRAGTVSHPLPAAPASVVRFVNDPNPQSYNHTFVATASGSGLFLMTFDLDPLNNGSAGTSTTVSNDIWVFDVVITLISCPV